MTPRATLTLVLACTWLVSAGCLRPLEPCQFDGLSGAIDTCSDPDICFEDRDGDGIAAAYPLEECGADELQTGTYGDCDDTDDNNFPGNPEVCDGLDNDCNGEPDFNDEEHDVAAGTLPACAPGAEVGLFLRGGGSVGGVKADATVNSVSLPRGESLAGALRLRAIFDEADIGDLSAVLTISWAPREDAIVPIWDPRSEVLPVPDASPYDFTVELPDDFAAPEGGTEGSFYITIAAAVGTGAPHLAALSSPSYCCEGTDCPPPEQGAPCEPVWSDQADGIQDPDLARLTELDLGGCATFGAASVNELFEGRNPLGARCTIGDPQCIPLYRPKAIGCRLVPLLVDGESR
jgi:hypothetical protein